MEIIDNITILENTGFIYTIEAELLNMDISVINFEIQN